MSNRQIPIYAAALLAALCTSPASAESDFERGYREGYSRGFQDGQNSKPSPPRSGFRHNPSGIVVTRAWYGDYRRSCDATSWAVRAFNNRMRADAEVTNGICGDPAPGQRKSLNVEYYCNGEAKSADAYEHRRISLSCY